MAGFAENDLYEAFGLEQPAVPAGGTPDLYGGKAADGSAGGKDPEPAEPGAQQEPGAEPAAGGDHEPENSPEVSREPEGEEPPPQAEEGLGGDQPQTAEQRREHAARRRRAETQAAIDAAVKQALEEERARSKGQMDAFFARANMKNTVTGQPITTLEEFEAWRRDYETAQAQKELKAGRLTPETIQTVVQQLPAVKRLEELAEEQARAAERQRQAAAQARVDAELQEIHKLDPSISTVEDLLAMPTAKAFYDLVRKGNSFLDAYRLANFEKLTAAKTDAARQQALNNARSKDHLTATGTPAGTGALPVPQEEMDIFRAFNPGATDAEITAYYNKIKKK